MKETIYTTWARSDHHWVKDMLAGWQNSRKSYLCFPWILFEVHTLPATPFWMYFYYAKGRTDILNLQGRLEYRVHVVSWQPKSKYIDDDIHVVRETEDGKVWFLCDRFEVIIREDGELLSLLDFKHVLGYNLISTIRSSIPQVELKAKIRLVRSFPQLSIH